MLKLSCGTGFKKKNRILASKDAVSVLFTQPGTYLVLMKHMASRNVQVPPSISAFTLYPVFLLFRFSLYLSTLTADQRQFTSI